MRSWFFHPGAAMIAGVCPPAVGTAGGGHRARAAERPVHPRLEPLLEPRPALHRLGDRPPGRSGHPFHGQDRDARLVLHRLAGDPVGNLLRAPWRGRPSGAQRFSLETLADGRPIAIFPEGTRSRDGRLKAFKSGCGVPCHPLRRADPAGGDRRIAPSVPERVALAACDPHDRARRCHRLSLGHQPTGRIDREALETATERMRDAVRALLPPSQRGD